MTTIKQIITTNHKTIGRLDLEILISYVISQPREFILAHPEQQLTKTQVAKLNQLIKRRLKNEPIAYLVGHKEFYGLDFIVNKDVLVPRPETELMVEEGLGILKNLDDATIVDVGTGSGAIITSLIFNFQFSIFKQFPNFKFSKHYNYFAIDISKKALSISKKNILKHNLSHSIKLLHGNLLEPIMQKKSSILNIKSKILIFANLPYLTPAQIKNSPSIQKEPRLALVAGADGLKYYRELFLQIKKMQNQSPISGYILCEIDPTQKKSLTALAKKILDPDSIEIKKDLKGHSRLAIIEL